jgi:adenylate kinase
MSARGEKVRADDNPDVLKGRLAAYRAQTAPLAAYYASKGMLKAVDGMAPIDDVTAAINRILRPAAAGKGKTKTKAKAKPAARTSGRRKAAKAKKPVKAKKPARRASKARAKPGRAKTSTRRAAAAGGKGRTAGRTVKKSGQRKTATKRRLTKAR